MKQNGTSPFSTWEFRQFVISALQEDIGPGDYSSQACIPKDAQGKAQFLFKENGIVAGISAVPEILKLVDSELKFKPEVADGEKVSKGKSGGIIVGPVRGILQAERLLLNLMQRLSGVATTTGKLVDMLQGYHTRLLDTRKTTPGMRIIEKWAVQIGGGVNHRLGLYDMIMLKDNHCDFAGGITQAVKRTQEFIADERLKLAIEVETRNLDEVKEVLAVGGVQRIMLDNFQPQLIVEALKIINRQVETEASGGITESNLLEYAKTGVDFISMGALTHSVKSLDISLKYLN